ncbi:MAG TPA: glycosyltransferase [Acidimicrobiia bacterium]|nr:glycosyltransferase [Acidimicrobiia bacterium]
MTERSAVQLSYRLGGSDGVAVEARKWEWALGELGYHVRRVAGTIDDARRPDDEELPFLAIEPPDGCEPDPAALATSLEGADIVVVENLCSLPINPDASALAARVLAEHEGSVVFHHHDLPWQRAGLLAPPGIPPRRAQSLHVTINDHSRHELEHRGFEAITIRNAFALDPVRGDHDGTRAAFGFAPDDLVLVQPTRAIPRKNVPGAIAFAAELAPTFPGRGVRLWITGPAEDRYGDVFDRLVADSPVPITVGRAPSAADAYAAADLVVFPSTWEGFGNPVIESIAHRRAVAVGDYPVLQELREFGVELLSVDDPEGAAAWLREPRPDVLEANVERVRPHCSLVDLPQRLGRALERLGGGSR